MVCWEVLVTGKFDEWWTRLVDGQQDALAARIGLFRDVGPALGRPTVDTVTGSSLANLKELRASVGRADLRVLFAFDPRRQAVLLVGGNKAGNWKTWYRRAIPEAEQLYRAHLEKLTKEE